jgi:hypothetical protein
MGVDALHEPRAQAEAAVAVEHEHVADVGEHGAVGDDAGEAYLALSVVDAEAERVLDGAGQALAVDAERPVRLAGEVAVYHVEIDPRRVGADHEVAASQLHAR